MHNVRFRFWTAAATLVLITATARAEELVTNGDFEDTTGWGAAGDFDYPPGWQHFTFKPNAMEQQGGGNQIGGMTSAFVPSGPSPGGGDRRTASAVATGGPDWEFNFDFAVEDPTTGTDRTLDIGLVSNNHSLFLRVTGGGVNGAQPGTIQGYQNTWQTIPGLEGAVTFDPDVQVARTVQHWKVKAHFSNDPPTYDITISRDGQSDIAATGAFFHINPGQAGPSSDSNLHTIVFHNSTGSVGDYVIDNVSLQVSGALSGDHNSDGSIDAADYVVWRKTNINDQQGYDDWRANFAAMSNGASLFNAAVPEPSSIVLLILSFVLAGNRSFTRRVHFTSHA